MFMHLAKSFETYWENAEDIEVIPDIDSDAASSSGEVLSHYQELAKEHSKFSNWKQEIEAAVLNVFQDDKKELVWLQTRMVNDENIKEDVRDAINTRFRKPVL